MPAIQKVAIMNAIAAEKRYEATTTELVCNSATPSLKYIRCRGMPTATPITKVAVEKKKKPITNQY